MARKQRDTKMGILETNVEGLNHLSYFEMGF